VAGFLTGTHQGTFVCEMTGEILDDASCEDRALQYEAKRGWRWVQIGVRVLLPF
jgi:hypothetical protein